MEWKNEDTVLLASYLPDKVKKGMDMIGFDLDGTLIEPKSGSKFSKNSDDWKFLFPNVVSTLKELSKTYQVVIYTNQKGLNNDTKIKEFQDKLDKIVKKMGINVYLFAALKDDEFRKPLPGMYSTYMKPLCGNNMTYYCGDAAGRKEDFSDTDLKFALNLGIPFKIPEQVFEDTSLEFTHTPDYFDVLKKTKGNYDLKFRKKEMVILIGLPGSGKSNIATLFPDNYLVVNRDTLGTIKKCLKEAETGLKNGKCVVIDNTNMGADSRKEFIDLGKKYGYSIRAINLKTPKMIYQHNNRIRSYLSGGKIKRIPEIVYRTMTNKYQEPTKAEGFDEIEEHTFKLQNTDAVKNGKYFTYMT